MTEVGTSPVQRAISTSNAKINDEKGDGGRRRSGGRRNKRRRSGGDSTVGGGRPSKQTRRNCHFPYGGSRKDPLNLSGIGDGPTGQTPSTSPIEVEIVVPKNVRDPLNLQKHGHRRKRKRRDSAKDRPPSPTSFSDSEVRVSKEPANKVARSTSTMSDHSKSSKSPVPIASPPKTESITEVNSKVKAPDRFKYGNYNRYYGKRLVDRENDPRFEMLKREWIESKHVLDIGCNVGYFALKLARDMGPERILGLDIDGGLVGIARKNIRHYCDQSIKISGKFPTSFGRQFGPISATCIAESGKFPDNVWFRCENYVFDTDEMLKNVGSLNASRTKLSPVVKVTPTYDTILALSISKWVHLNWGDSGLRRFFKRIFLELKPGGLFVLEPQNLSSYPRRSKITPEMKQNYERIQLKPDQFTQYLIEEVGFESFSTVGPTKTMMKGFQRPIHVYLKSSANSEPNNDGK